MAFDQSINRGLLLTELDWYWLGQRDKCAAHYTTILKIQVTVKIGMHDIYIEVVETLQMVVIK